jgi:hypothetical protein
MSRRTIHVRRIQEVELVREHWVNGQRFSPGTVLCLPATCASNLIEAGAAKVRDTEPSNSDSN